MSRRAMAYRVIAAAMLISLAGYRLLATRAPADTRQYHERIRTASTHVPQRIGGWIGRDVTVPAQAIAVLRPNVMISRRYVSIESGLSAGMLLVHCADAHDMAGHFPPRCYPANGWTQRSQRPRDWTVGETVFTGMEYQYTIDAPGRSSAITVANCLLLPDNRIVRDMNGMAKLMAGVQGQWSGAGQIQIYFDASVPERERDEAVRSLIGGCMPLVRAILSSVSGG